MSTEGDIVLIYHKNEPGIYARIEKILPDIKKDWYQVTLTLLAIPPQVITWILRAEYIDGATFTMGGNEMRMEILKPLPPENNAEPEEIPAVRKKNPAKNKKVITFKKKKPS